MNELSTENFVLLFWYKLMRKNMHINEEYVLALRRRYPTRAIKTNSKGVAVTTSYEDSMEKADDTYGPNSERKSVDPDCPVSVLKNPGDIALYISWFNAVFYIMFYGPFFERLQAASDILPSTYSRLVNLLDEGYNKTAHVNCKRCERIRGNTEKESPASFVTQGVCDIMETMAESTDVTVLLVSLARISSAHALSKIKHEIQQRIRTKG